MFILCQKDNTPEVVIQVDGDEIFGKCNACGHVQQLDKNHKMTIYMKKHPPKKLHDIKIKDQGMDEKAETKQDIPLNLLKYPVRESIKDS